MSQDILVYSRTSSASLRTILARDLLKISDERVKLKHIDPNELGKNPERRYPFMHIHDKGLLTQSGAICDYLEQISASEVSLVPKSAWERIRMKQVINLVQCDIHPLQNLTLVKQLVKMGMEAHEPIHQHPFRLMVIRRGFKGLEAHLEKYNCSGTFCVGNSISLAECYLIPQIRNALGAGLDLKSEFPRIHKIWSICLENSIISNALEFVGGIANEYKKT